jgi:hypothetical protein
MFKKLFTFITRPGKKREMGTRVANQIGLESRIRIRIKLKNLEAQKGSMEGSGRSQWRRGGSKWNPIGSVDNRSQIRITLMRRDPDPQ